MIQIFNLRAVKPLHEWDVRVDRTSPLGNPYFMGAELQRDEVCNLYEVWLHNHLADANVATELERLITILRKYGKINLFCWCAPKRCHAETIREYLESRLGS